MMVVYQTMEKNVLEKKIKAISLLIEIIWNLIQWISNQSFCRIKRWRHFWRKCTSTIQDWRQRTAAAIEQNLITKNYCSDSKLELFLFMGKIKSVPFLRESIRKKYASCTFLKGKCTDTFRDRQRKTTKAIEQKVDRSRQAILLYRGGECICCCRGVVRMGQWVQLYPSISRRANCTH